MTTLQLYAAAVARKQAAEAALDKATADCRRVAQRLTQERTAAAEAATKARKQ